MEYMFAKANALKKPHLCKGRWHALRDGGIVKKQSRLENNPSPPTAELPLHKGAYGVVSPGAKVKLLRSEVATQLSFRGAKVKIG